MLVKIIDKTSGDYEKEFKVRRMNFDQVVVNYPSNKGINVFDIEVVEFITENDVDKFLIENKDFLKIKLNRGISVALYKAIYDSLELQLEIKFKSLDLLRDKYTVNKRGVWEKEILGLINENVPLKISASGQNFKRTGYNLSIDEIPIEEFLDICSFEIKKIRQEIEDKEKILSRYGSIIEKLKSPINSVKMLT